MSECPLLKRFGLDRTDCTFACALAENCVWARWHQLDPTTGKPTLRRPDTSPAQKDLFA